MGVQNRGLTVENSKWLMREYFAAGRVTSPLLKRSDRPAVNTLSAAPMSIKKNQFIIVTMTSKEGRGARCLGIH